MKPHEEKLTVEKCQYYYDSFDIVHVTRAGKIDNSYVEAQGEDEYDTP